MAVPPEVHALAAAQCRSSGWPVAPQPWAGLGLEYFVLPDSPHLEGACRFAELASPLLPQALRVELSQPQRTGLFGDIVANADVPQAANAAH